MLPWCRVLGREERSTLNITDHSRSSLPRAWPKPARDRSSVTTCSFSISVTGSFKALLAFPHQLRRGCLPCLAGL